MTNERKNLLKVDDAVEKLYLEVLARVSLGKLSDFDKFFSRRLRDIVSTIKAQLSSHTIFRRNTTVQKFVDALLSKYITFWVVTRILTTEQIYQFLPQSVLKDLAVFSGFDIGNLLKVNGLLLSFTRQLLEFKDTPNTINLLLSWNFNYSIGTVCAVDLQPDREDPLNTRKMKLILVDSKHDTRIGLPATLYDILKDFKQTGNLGESLLIDETKINAQLLKSSGGTSFRTNFIAFLLQPFGEDLRLLSARQSKLIASLLFYANKVAKGVKFHSNLFDTDFTILEAVIFYISLIQLGNFLYDKHYNVKNKPKSFPKKTTVNLLNPYTPFKSVLVTTLTRVFLSLLDVPYSVARKLAIVYANHYDELTGTKNLADLWNLITKYTDLTDDELSFLTPNQEKLLRITELLPVLINTYGVALPQSTVENTEEFAFTLPGISSDTIIAPVLHRYNKMLDLLVLIKRLYDEQIIDSIAIFYTAELFLKEISEALEVQLPVGLSLALTFSLDPGTPLFKVLAWLKPVYTNFLILAIQLIGEPSLKVTPLSDVYLDNVRDSFPDNTVQHRFAQYYSPKLCDTTIPNFGTYITASNERLSKLKIFISKFNPKEYYDEFIKPLLKKQPQKFYRSIEQLTLDAYGQLYNGIIDSDFGYDSTYEILGYTEKDRDMIDLVFLSEYDPDANVFTLLRNEIPPALWET